MRPTERYEPGELEKTRKNLGLVSAEEAKRISQLLGGETGVERTSESVENQYQKINDLNRRRSDRIIADTVRFDVQKSAGSRPVSIAPGSTTDGSSIDHNRTKYFDLLRMNFTAAQPEHAVKTLGGAIASVFSPVIAVRDFVSPRFILGSDNIFFAHIENLVLSVRGLLALNRKNPLNSLRTPFYRTILELIKRWDIEGIHIELNRLQKSPRTLTFRYCGTLARKTFDPIVRLIDIDAVYHLRGALKRLYDLNIMSVPKKHADVEKIKAFYHEAVFETEYVFIRLKNRLYPLLMKLCCVRHAPAERFYFDARNEILDFLSIGKDELVTLPKAVELESTEASEVEPAAESDEYLLESPANQKGLEVLERIFPRAGWDRLDEYPDLYPYLEPILSFPHGFELVPPEDPFHQVFVIASILQELFYGFRHLRFGYLSESVGSRLGDDIQQILEGWRIIRDEFLARSYLPQLYDYCREIERNPRYAESEYGERKNRDLLWQKKDYLLPHLIVHRGSAPEGGKLIPRLYELISDLTALLSAVSKDVAMPETEEIRSVRNPWECIVFDIESPLTKRIRRVMSLYHEAPNNANLLLYTYSILVLFDSLVNDETSFYYPLPAEPLYRCDEARFPVYSVQQLDPQAIFQEADRRVPDPEPPPSMRRRVLVDELTGLLNENGLREKIDCEIVRFRTQNTPFSILSILLPRFENHCEEHGEEAGVILLRDTTAMIAEQIREYRDIPSRVEGALFTILLPETLQDEAINLAIRILAASTRHKPDAIPVAVGLVQVHKTWSRDRTVKMARRAAVEAAELPPPSIAIFDERENAFRTLSDVRS